MIFRCPQYCSRRSARRASPWGRREKLRVKRVVAARYFSSAQVFPIRKSYSDLVHYPSFHPPMVAEDHPSLFTARSLAAPLYENGRPETPALEGN